MSTELRLAMIGCGRRAPSFINTVSVMPRAKIVALCDRFEPRVQLLKAAAKDASIRPYTDHRRMLAEGGFDAVLVVTEPEHQAELAAQAMEAGYPAFSEVPVGLSLEDCWRVVLASERTGQMYYLGEQIRHTHHIRCWQQMVRDGVLGSILFVEGHYIHPMAADRYWRDSATGEVLTWEEAAQCPTREKSRFWTLTHPIFYGPHELSPLLKVIDDRITRVCCFSTGSPNRRFAQMPFPGQFETFVNPDMEVALMHTQKKAIFRFAANFTSPVGENHWYHVQGTHGEIETRRGMEESGYQYVYEKPIIGKHDYRKPRSVVNWDEQPDVSNDPLAAAARATGHGGADFGPVHDFVNSQLDGTPPDIDVYQAMDTAAPCIVAAHSAERDGETLDVPDFRPGPHRQKGQTLSSH